VVAGGAARDHRDPSLQRAAVLEAPELAVDDDENLLNNVGDRLRWHSALAGVAPHEVEVCIVYLLKREDLRWPVYGRGRPRSAQEVEHDLPFADSSSGSQVADPLGKRRPGGGRSRRFTPVWDGRQCRVSKQPQFNRGFAAQGAKPRQTLRPGLALRHAMQRRTPLRASISGAGAAGCMHALTYRSAGVSVVGVFDPHLARAQALAELCGARAVASPEALFAIDSELVSVCSPPPAHAFQAERACRPDRIVFVEKPVATNAAQLERVVHLGRCVPVLQWRAGRALRSVRAAIHSGELGDTPSVSCDLAWSRDSAYFEAGRATQSAWGGGVLLSVAIHAIDAICFALGRRLASASGSLGYRADADVETSAIMTMTFQGGALAAVRATFDSSADATRLSFVGRQVVAVIEGSEVDPTAGRVIWHARDPARLRALQAIEDGCDGARDPPLLVPFMHDAIEAVKRGAAPGECDTLPSVESAREAHDAVFRVYESVSGQPAATPL